MRLNAVTNKTTASGTGFREASKFKYGYLLISHLSESSIELSNIRHIWYQIYISRDYTVVSQSKYFGYIFEVFLTKNMSGVGELKIVLLTPK